LCRCTTHAGWTTNELSVLMLVSCCAASTATGTGTGTGRQDSAPEPGDARPCDRGWRRPALTTDTVATAWIFEQWPFCAERIIGTCISFSSACTCVIRKNAASNCHSDYYRQLDCQVGFDNCRTHCDHCHLHPMHILAGIAVGAHSRSFHTRSKICSFHCGRGIYHVGHKDCHHMVLHDARSLGRRSSQSRTDNDARLRLLCKFRRSCKECRHSRHLLGGRTRRQTSLGDTRKCSRHPAPRTCGGCRVARHHMGRVVVAAEC
jgi:hypothetical protein